MKIIAVFHDNNILSGATLSYLSIIEYLHYDENKIIAVIPKKDGELEKHLNSMGIETIRGSYGGNVYNADSTGVKKIKGVGRCFFKGIISFFTALVIAHKLRNEDLELVYTNTSTINIGFWISKFLRLKHIWHFREFCLEDQNSLRLFEKGFVHKARSSSRVITISNALNRYYKEKYSLSNTLMLYDDLSPNYIINRHKNWDYKTINILVTGTFSEGKGQKIALKAIERLSNPSIHLYFAGKINAYAEELMKYVESNEINNVHFCGLVEDMNQLRSKMNLSIVCSKSEAFGRTIIEDMLAGIIVIGASCGSVPELITNYHNGLIYQYGDVEDLCKTIDYAISEHCKRENIIDNAYDFAIGFTRNATAEKISVTMQEILANK